MTAMLSEPTVVVSTLCAHKERATALIIHDVDSRHRVVVLTTGDEVCDREAEECVQFVLLAAASAAVASTIPGSSLMGNSFISRPRGQFSIAKLQPFPSKQRLLLVPSDLCSLKAPHETCPQP